MRFNKRLFWIVIINMAIITWAVNTFAAPIEIVTDGLISYWTLDNSSISGKTVRDSLGKNNGIMIGSPKIVAGKINEALSFNGKDDCVEIAHSDSLNLKTAITIDFWFTKTGKTSDAQPYPRAVSKGQSTVSDGAYGVWVADQPNTLDIGFRYPDAQGTTRDFSSGSVADFSDGNWHYIAATYDGKTGRIYLDGAKVVDAQKSGDMAQTKDPLHIGDGNNQRHFNGAIDEVRIYNRALDEKEILKNFNAKSNSIAVVPAFKISTFWGSIKTQ